MNESGFTSSINKKLPSQVFSWKINCRFANGTPDAWYSALRSDLWVEYKFLQKFPVKGVKPKLSALQLKWLKERHNEGRNVAVVVGSPNGCLIYENLEWETHKSVKQIVPKSEVVKFINNKVSNDIL